MLRAPQNLTIPFCLTAELKLSEVYTSRDDGKKNNSVEREKMKKTAAFKMSGARELVGFLILKYSTPKLNWVKFDGDTKLLKNAVILLNSKIVLVQKIVEFC